MARHCVAMPEYWEEDKNVEEIVEYVTVVKTPQQESTETALASTWCDESSGGNVFVPDGEEAPLKIDSRGHMEETAKTVDYAGGCIDSETDYARGCIASETESNHPTGARLTVAQTVKMRDEIKRDLADLILLVSINKDVLSCRTLQLLQWHRDQYQLSLERIDAAFENTEVGL